MGTIMRMAPYMARPYVVMEVKQNLTAADRKENLKRFNLPHFKKIANVVMGEPTDAAYKAKNNEAMLAEKQSKSDVDWRQKKRRKRQKKRRKRLRRVRKQR